MKTACLLVATIVLAACGGSSEDPPVAAPPTSAPAVATTIPPAPHVDRSKLGTRPPDAAARATIRGVLDGATADKRVWFVCADQANPMLAALESTFRDDGWQVATKISPEIPIKEGDIRILVAGAGVPAEAALIRRALEAGGLRVATASGYRAYYEERTRKNPTWPTVPIDPDQPFVVVIPPPSVS